MRNVQFAYLLVAGQELPDGNGRWRADLNVEGAQQAAGQDYFRRSRHGVVAAFMLRTPHYTESSGDSCSVICDPCSVGQLHGSVV